LQCLTEFGLARPQSKSEGQLIDAATSKSIRAGRSLSAECREMSHVGKVAHIVSSRRTAIQDPTMASNASQVNGKGGAGLNGHLQDTGDHVVAGNERKAKLVARDFRSDTITIPTVEMFQAMMEASRCVARFLSSGLMV
jgi:hypothetical protein